jgi:thiol-disulfide isomerase/thioredoxin
MCRLNNFLSFKSFCGRTPKNGRSELSRLLARYRKPLKSILISIAILIFNLNPAFAINFNAKHAILFFYAASCPHCQTTAPELAAFAEDFGIRVRPLALDNQPIYPFNDFTIPDEALVRTVFQEKIRYPALFLVNTDTLKIYPLSVGAMNYQELTQRFLSLQDKVETYENT